MNYRNNPGTGNQENDWHGGHRQAEGPPNKSFGAKSGGYKFGGDLPTMPPAASPLQIQVQDILPAVLPDSSAQLVETTATATSKASGFSLANLGEIKGFVDRMGGIDGILSTVTKVQKVMSSVSQMAPLVKVLLGSFGKKSATISEDDDDGELKPKRRKRRKPGSGSGNGAAARRRAPKRPR